MGQVRRTSAVVGAAVIALVLPMGGPAAAATVSEPIIEGLAGPLQLAVGSDGTVYVGQSFSGALTAIDKKKGGEGSRVRTRDRDRRCGRAPARGRSRTRRAARTRRASSRRYAGSSRTARCGHWPISSRTRRPTTRTPAAATASTTSPLTAPHRFRISSAASRTPGSSRLTPTPSRFCLTVHA